MTDSDDDLKRRYRELAREEPSSALDAAILAKSRQKLVSETTFPTSGKARRNAKVVSDTSFFRRWSAPLSLAAVLMLGIGVSLRMQMEKPGIETSMPEQQYSAPGSGAPPAAPEPVPPPAQPQAPPVDAFVPTPAAKPALKLEPEPKRDAAPEPLKERAEGALRADTSVAPEPQRQLERKDKLAVPPPPPAPAVVPAPTPTEAPAALAQPSAPATQGAPAASTPRAASATESVRAAPAPQAAPATPPATMAPSRAKREAESDNAVGAAGLRKSLADDSGRDRELERIAQLRESGQHLEADKALEEFRRRYPGFRIPEAMLERVKAR